ncbi:MAG TPA: TetR/AcrR family transcriptional regulator [Pseudonocardiaceae bacterium]|jgi:AcrR family transcriptional regulator
MTNGRVNQKLRTRTEILRAAAELIRTGRDVTMIDIAKAALVSEATAYRHFPDLPSLLAETLTSQTSAAALATTLDSDDPVQRVALATERLLRHVLTYQGAVRAMIAATITRPATAQSRPGLRFGLIDTALAPLADTLDPAAFAQLKNDLAVVVSAEALFSLTDLVGLTPDAAVASAVHTATTLVSAALRG